MTFGKKAWRWTQQENLWEGQTMFSWNFCWDLFDEVHVEHPVSLVHEVPLRAVKVVLCEPKIDGFGPPRRFHKVAKIFREIVSELLSVVLLVTQCRNWRNLLLFSARFYVKIDLVTVKCSKTAILTTLQFLNFAYEQNCPFENVKNSQR